MQQIKLIPIRFENGIWEGHLDAESLPQVEARFRGQPLPDVEVTQSDDGWRVRVPVPASLLSDGVHSVTIWESATDEKLGDFAVIAGLPAGDDIRAEIDLLRAELDMLKRVVRRLHAGRD